MENEENIKNTIQDTQMLIRNHMQHHKKISKQLHSQIKKDTKTKELFKEKIGKLVVEKERLEAKQQIKSDTKEAQLSTPDIENLRKLIFKEVKEKDNLNEKIQLIQERLLVTKNKMGGLNATQQQQERYEKHIRILENRLDKANQKFNDSVEYDKKLRAEIDKLRKERFFFENIYKRLEKDLEKVRKEISKNLEEAYDNYEQRDINQETFENLKAHMIKKETEYTNILSNLANDMNIRNSRKKSMEQKELKNMKNEENINESEKNYAKKIKNEQYEQQRERLLEKHQNLRYKFEKLVEFTEQKDVGTFCEKFKKNAQKNFELFVEISMKSNEVKKLEMEIKEMEEEINGFQQYKVSQQGIERHSLLSELKAKTQKIIQKQNKYDTEYEKFNEQFIKFKSNIEELFITLNCLNMCSEEEQKIDFENGINRNNALKMLAKIEKQLKYSLKVLEYERNQNQENSISNLNESMKGTLNPKQVNDNMKIVFASMDIGKIKAMEEIKNDHKTDDFKFENLQYYSLKVAKELMDGVKKQNQNDKNKQKHSQKRKSVDTRLV